MVNSIVDSKKAPPLNPRIGTAGWNIPLNVRDRFPAGNSLLQRYSQFFNAVEINSSFYRSHQRKTYERWATSTPQDFLFAVKIPQTITHLFRLVNIKAPLSQFLDEVRGLNDKLGPLLIQLPPSLKFEQEIAANFFYFLRTQFDGVVVIEPRHISWTEQDARVLLAQYHLIQVNADPKIVHKPSNQPFEYYRLHGSPKIYESSYNFNYLNQLATNLTNTSWVIFNNTKFNAALENAIALKTL